MRIKKTVCSLPFGCLVDRSEDSSPLLFLETDHAVNATFVPQNIVGAKPSAFLGLAADRRRLTKAHFQQQHTIRLQIDGSLLQKPTMHIHSIGPAG